MYKVLGIWKCHYRWKKSLVSCMKPRTDARNNNKHMKYHSKLTYQLILIFESKNELSCRRQVVYLRPQAPQGESVAKPETPLLIILNIACKHEVHGNLFSPLFGAYSSTCCKGTYTCAGTMGVESIRSHPPGSGCRHSTMPRTTNVLRDILPP